MSPKKSPGQELGQLLDAEGRALIGRAVDLDWDVFRPHETAVAAAPAVVLDRLGSEERERVGTEEWVAWRICVVERCECNRVPKTEGLLDEFLTLENAEAVDVQRFVYERGVIAGCEHLRPHYECVELLGSDSLDGTPPDIPWRWYWEAPATYRYYARLFRSILAIAAKLQFDEPQDLDLWAAVLPVIQSDGWEGLQSFDLAYDVMEPGPTDFREFAARVLSAGFGRTLLGEIVNHLMGESPVTVAFRSPLHDDRWIPRPSGTSADEYVDVQPRIRLAGDTFGVLTYQLALAIQGSLFAVCTNCRHTYVPGRKPQVGRDNYCPACRDARKAAYKRRRREG